MNQPFLHLDNLAERSNKTRMNEEIRHQEYASRPGGVLINKLN